MSRFYPDDRALERVASLFLERGLPKAEWTHAAHFAAALWLLRYRPQIRLEAEMPPMIRAYNVASGGENTDTAGYHETITQASIAAARAALGEQPWNEPLHLVLDNLMAGPLGRPDWLLAHWSKPRLFSVAARRNWVEPDLAPLPWPIAPAPASGL